MILEPWIIWLVAGLWAAQAVAFWAVLWRLWWRNSVAIQNVTIAYANHLVDLQHHLDFIKMAKTESRQAGGSN